MSITLMSGSEGATRESLDRVLASHGYEPEEEPKAEDPKPEEKPAPTPEQIEWQRHCANYAANTNEFRLTHSDWEQVVCRDVPIGELVVREIIKNESADVAYFLGLNPGVLDGLHRMHPQQVAAEVARLAANLKAIPTGRPTLRMRSGSTRNFMEKVPGEGSRHEEKSERTAREAARQGDYKAFRDAERAKRRGGLGQLA
jgi:hypothetical protein